MSHTEHGNSMLHGEVIGNELSMKVLCYSTEGTGGTEDRGALSLRRNSPELICMM